MQPVNMIMIFETSAITVIWNTPCKKMHPMSLRHQINVFLIVIISTSRTSNIFWVTCLSNRSLSYYEVASISKEFWMILSLNKLWHKIFLLLSKSLRSRINSCYSKLFSNLKLKKCTTLLLVELLAVNWVLYILRDPILVTWNHI